MDWIIGISCSEAEGVRLYSFSGTISQVKEKLVSLVKEDRENDFESYDCGTEKVEEISDFSNGGNYELYAFANYSDYHIDYTAKELSHIKCK